MTNAVRIAHISDVHLAPVSGFHPRYWSLKRGLGLLNWHRKRRHVHLREVADAVAADAMAQEPDHIIVSGDLANIGLPAEYAAARDWLEALGDPARVTVVPGNHDIYTARLHGASCLADWAPYMRSDAWGTGQIMTPDGGFPFVRRVGDIALIGLNSAVPTPPFVAAGRLGPRQRADLGEVLKRIGEAGLTRVVVIHHPPLAGDAPRLRGLRDAEELETVLQAHGAELVLHGHNHRDMLSWRRWNGQSVPVIGVASASSGVRHKNEPLARYNLVTLRREGDGVRIEVETRGLAAPGGAIVEIARREIAPAVNEPVT